MEPFERLTSPENLYWAWGKVRRYYRTTDAWFNEAELAAFESNLETELGKLREQFRSKTYRTSPLLPLPQPKALDNEGTIHVNAYCGSGSRRVPCQSRVRTANAPRQEVTQSHS